MKHFEICGWNLNAITLNDFDIDADFLGDTDDEGNWFREYSFDINEKNSFFDNISLKIWGDDDSEISELEPEYIWLTKKKYSIKKFIDLLEDITQKYGNNFIGNKLIQPFDDEGNIKDDFKFYRNWDNLKVDYGSSEPMLTITAQFSDYDLQFKEDVY